MRCRTPHLRKRYHNDQKRKVLLSREHLRGIYYEWRRVGERAFALNYRTRLRPEIERLFGEWLELCVSAGITSRGRAWRWLKVWQVQEGLFPAHEPFPRRYTFERRLTRDQIRALDRFHEAARQSAEAKRGLVRAFKGGNS